MRKVLIAVSIFALPLALSACDNSKTDPAATTTGQPAWSSAHARDLAAIIGRRAEHGLDQLPCR